MASKRLFLAVALVAAGLAAACESNDPSANGVTATYNDRTGRLETLAGDSDGDGKVDVRADMDGLAFKRVSIDRTGDGEPDRWEYYEQAAARANERGQSKSVLARADEANGPDAKRVSRREFYLDGRISRIEEDGDFDGRPDKWDYYESGALIRMEIDLSGRGRPDRRLFYGRNGEVDHVEADEDGDGIFVRLPPTKSVAGGKS
jgi:hypothetical protein